jgi:uncharacterized protein (DUF1697 family)
MPSEKRRSSTGRTGGSAATSVFVALFRGINVGGNHLLPMNDLRRVLERNGCTDVQTYVQSGNAVFRSATPDTNLLARRVAAAISKRHGFEPCVLVLRQDELERAAKGNPFPEAGEHPKNLHLFFLSAPPGNADVTALQALKAETEQFALRGTTFYLHTPDGFGTSRLAGRAEKLLGVQATARNWRTVTRLLDLMNAVRMSGKRTDTLERVR